MKKISLVLIVSLMVSIIAGCSGNTTRFPAHDEAAASMNQSLYESENEPDSHANSDFASNPESGLTPEISGGTPLAPDSVVSARNSSYRGNVLGLMHGTPIADNPDASHIILVTMQHSEGEDYGQTTLMVTIDGNTRFNGITISDVTNGAYLEVFFDCDPAQGSVTATSVGKFQQT